MEYNRESIVFAQPFVNVNAYDPFNTVYYKLRHVHGLFTYPPSFRLKKMSVK